MIYGIVLESCQHRYILRSGELDTDKFPQGFALERAIAPRASEGVVYSIVLENCQLR